MSYKPLKTVTNVQLLCQKLFFWQDEDDDLLKEALAMSMGVAGSNPSWGDAEMSDANAEDQELALGKLHYFSQFLYSNPWTCLFFN